MDMRAKEDIWAAAMRAERSGNAVAYEALLKEIADTMRGIFLRDLARFGLISADAEDLVQEVLMAVHSRRHTWESDRPFLPWLRAIARYKLLDAARKAGREAKVRIPVPMDVLAEFIEAPVADFDRSLLDVERHLSPLSQWQQAVVRSLALEGASVRSTAQKFHKSEVAIRVTFHRALLRLKDMAGGNTTE